MPSVFNPADNQFMIDRIEKLTPESQALWGKMNVNQMLRHCKIAGDVAFGIQDLKINFVMKILGRLLKKKVFYGGDLKKNSPTAKEFIISENPDFEIAQSELIANFKRLINEGTACVKNLDHPFWGKLSYEDWDALMWKHTDHHLKQFGV